MRHGFVFDDNEINEQVLVEEALERLHEDSKDKTMIHFHLHGYKCNQRCYLVKEAKDA